MSEKSSARDRRLRIVHVLRSPVGGLFRHVIDLVQGQIERGHEVGLIADSVTGGPQADTILADLAPHLALGVARLPMQRDPHPSDAMALSRVLLTLRAARADVVHGHGSKGGLYSRLGGWLRGREPGPIRVYTPHGGSLHFSPGSLKGRLVLGVERLLVGRSDLILFESAFAADRFRAAIGEVRCASRVVLNGLAPAEFVPVAPHTDAADFLYVGELRALKGVDVFLEAFAAACAASGRALRATLVGSGPDRATFESWGQRLGLSGQIAFTGAMPARVAFTLGRTLVVPSRAESLPYVVLEAAAAGLPILATRVGGIPEIFGPQQDRLVPSDDVTALRDAMLADLAQAPADRASIAERLRARVLTEFSRDRMVEGVIAAYRDVLASRAAHPTRPASPRVGVMPSRIPHQ